MAAAVPAHLPSRVATVDPFFAPLVPPVDPATCGGMAGTDMPSARSGVCRGAVAAFAVVYCGGAVAASAVVYCGA